MGCMNEAIERVIADVHRYTEAGEALAARLHSTWRGMPRDIERLRSGMTMTESCRITDSAERSRNLTRILAEFEQSRRAIRASSVLALLDEGMTITEIGVVFGVSRQLANRLVKDARAMYAESPADAVGTFRGADLGVAGPACPPPDPVLSPGRSLQLLRAGPGGRWF